MQRSPRFQVSLRPAVASDYGKLNAWFSQKWLTEFWSATWLSSPEKWQQELRNQKTKRFIACAGPVNKPIGYAQVYHACEVGDGWWPQAVIGEWGFDLFIGEKIFLGSGWGGALIRQLCTYLFAKENASLVFADPEPANHKITQSLALQGFKATGTVTTPDGLAEIWVMNKRDWNKEKFSQVELAPAPMPLAERGDYEFARDGLMVMQAAYLARRGYCCGNSCRNCPYKTD